MLVYWLDIVGTAVFAISGVLLAGKLRMDPFGVLVLGVVTAVGGGTIRDMALDHGPVFWVKDPTDLVVAMVTSMLTIVLVRQPRRLPKWMLPVLDAVGLAVFVRIKGFIHANADKHRQTDGIKNGQDPFRQPARLADQQDGQHAGDHRHHQIGGIFDPEYRAIRQRHVADGPAAYRRHYP